MAVAANSYIGQVCEVVVPIDRNSTVAVQAEAQHHAQDTANAKCRGVGCSASDVTLITRRPWPGPQQNLELLVYHAIALEEPDGQ